MTDTEARVEYIAELMAALIWSPETTRKLQTALAERWGVGRERIRQLSAEAHRALDAGIREARAPIAAKALRGLQAIAEDRRLMHVPGGPGAAVRAHEVLLTATGYSKPEEDKERESTLTVLDAGAKVASPVFKALFGKTKPKA